MIDLKSDTVTKPSRDMLIATLGASFKDAYFETDESTRELEENCAKLFGFEDALFTVSGTMANQIALKTHTKPGDAVLLDESYHINHYEAAATSIISQVHLNTLKSPNGIIEPDLLDGIIEKRSNSVYSNEIKLLCLENSINYYSGKIYPYAKLLAISNYAKNRGWAVHLDGARIFNALVEEKIVPDCLSKTADSMMISLTKGLGSPFGSVLLGTKKFIHQARIYNKWMGGGMHQSGVLAAMGLYALINNFSKIKNDNDNAKLLCSLLRKNGIGNVKIPDVETNIVMLDLSNIQIPAKKVVDELATQGIRLHEWSHYVVRAVTNLNITKEDIVYCAEIISTMIKLSSEKNA